MTLTASMVISCRTGTVGHSPVTGTSFIASPAPTATPTLPGYICRRVANVCATIAGLYRMIGHVMQVDMNTSLVAWSAAPIQAQACADCALSWYQGWKWSSAHIESKPTFSALMV